MLFSDGPKVKIKLFHHGEIMVGINERLGDPEMNTVQTREQHDEKERRDREKQKQQEEKEAQKKGKKTWQKGRGRKEK